MTTLKPKSRSDRRIYSHPLWLYFLVSLLIHGLIALLIEHIGRSQPVTKKQQEKAPIEFVVVPPEEKPSKPPETKRRAANNSVAQGKIKSEKPPTTDNKGNAATEFSQAKPKSSQKTKPAQAVNPSPPVASKPKPIKQTQPPTPDNSVTNQSSSAPKPTSSGKQPLPKKTGQNSPVATRLSSQPQTVPSAPNSGKANLLGGTYQRSLKDDSGSSFLNPQANGSKQAEYAKLDAQQDDLGPYFEKMRRRVKRNWQPVSPGSNKFTVLTFVIQRNGQITELRMVKTSGNNQVDQDALDAVQKSGPFDPLPQSFKGDRLEIQFSFNIYIHQGSFSPNIGIPYP